MKDEHLYGGHALGRLAFVHPLLELRHRGVLLAICSKNNLADVDEVMDLPDLTLVPGKPEVRSIADFVCRLTSLTKITERNARIATVAIPKPMRQRLPRLLDHIPATARIRINAPGKSVFSCQVVRLSRMPAVADPQTKSGGKEIPLSFSTCLWGENERPWTCG